MANRSAADTLRNGNLAFGPPLRHDDAMTRVRRFLKAIPWPAWFGLTGFGLALWALMAWMPPTPRLVIDTDDSPVTITVDGLLVTGPRRGVRRHSRAWTDHHFWDCHSGTGVQLYDTSGQSIGPVNAVISNGRFLRDRDYDQFFYRRAPSAYQRVSIPRLTVFGNWRMSVAPSSGTYAIIFSEQAFLCDPGDGNKQTEITIGDSVAYPEECVAFSPDGRLVATGEPRDAWKPGSPNHAIVWDVATGAQVFAFADCPYLQTLQFSPDGHRLIAITAGCPGTTYVQPEEPRVLSFDLTTGRKVCDWPCTRSTDAIADGTAVLTYDRDTESAVQCLELATGEIRYAIPLVRGDNRWSYGAILRGDAKSLFMIEETLNYVPGPIVTWLSKFVKLGRLGQKGYLKQTHVYDVATGAQLASFPGGTGVILNDGSGIAVEDGTDADHAIYLYDLPSCRSWPRMLSAALLVGMAVAVMQMGLVEFWGWVSRR